MQAILSRAEPSAGPIKWLYHNLGWFAVIGLAFFAGMAVNNGDATKGAVTSVQAQYQGKLAYHVQNEKVIAKTAKTEHDACQRNLNAAMNNATQDEEVKGCPPVPPVVKAIVASPTK